MFDIKLHDNLTWFISKTLVYLFIYIYIGTTVLPKYILDLHRLAKI